MSLSSCTLCGSELSKDSIKCRVCNHWNVVANPKINSENDGTITLDKVKSASIDMLDAGQYNFCFSGGIVRTSATLIGGYPGAGKTTMLLDLAGILAKQTGKESLYIAAEQDLGEIKIYADRLNIMNMQRIRMLPAMSGEVESVPDILKSRKPGAIILDSLQGFVGEDDAKSVELCKIMKNFAVELKAPAIIISHVTKGDDFAGLMTLQHTVDTLMTLNADEVTGIRTLDVIKNRFGRAYINSQYEMNEDGLSIIELEEEEEERDEDEDEDE